MSAGKTSLVRMPAIRSVSHEKQPSKIQVSIAHLLVARCGADQRAEHRKPQAGLILGRNPSLSVVAGTEWTLRTGRW